MELTCDLRDVFFLLESFPVFLDGFYYFLVIFFGGKINKAKWLNLKIFFFKFM